jgi:hypothetical protein
VQGIQVILVTEVTEVMAHRAAFLTQEILVILAQEALEVVDTLVPIKLRVTAPQVLPAVPVPLVMFFLLGFKVLLVCIPQTLQLPMVTLL